CEWPPASILILLPARRSKRCASAAPATPSSAASENHRPSTRHQGSVAETPVVNALPSGTVTERLYHVPINCSRESPREPPDATVTGTSRNGANPMTLLRQK